jgi:hypothetical protein
MTEPKLDISWRAMSWEGARDNTLRAGARMSLAEKVAWLEQAHRTAIRLGALPDPDRRSAAGRGRAAQDE